MAPKSRSRAFFAAEARGLERLGRAAKAVRIPRVHRMGRSRRGRGGMDPHGMDRFRFPGLVLQARGGTAGAGACGNPPVRGGSLWVGGKQFHRDSSQPNGWSNNWADFTGSGGLCRKSGWPRTRTFARTAQPAPPPAVRPPRTVVGTPRPPSPPPARRPVERKRPGGQQKGFPSSSIRPPTTGTGRWISPFRRCSADSPPASTTPTTKPFPLRRGFPRESRCISSIICLVHLDLFGESYGPAVDRIAERYAG